MDALKTLKLDDEDLSLLLNTLEEAEHMMLGQLDNRNYYARRIERIQALRSVILGQVA